GARGVPGVPTSTIVSRRSAPEGFGRLAAALASTDDAGTRLESRLVVFTIATRWVTILAGTIFGIMKPPPGPFGLATLVLISFAAVQTFVQLRRASLRNVQAATVTELVVMIGAAMPPVVFRARSVLLRFTGPFLPATGWVDR